MIKKKLVKRLLIASIPVVMALSSGSLVYADTQALPNGTITNQNGVKYLTDSTGEKYSGWFIDSKEDWYYFNESDKTMKTGWHHDDKDGYWYYLNLSDGKMVTGWQTIEGKEYFFQPVRDMGNYQFSNEQEKWLYSVNSKVPYGAMYINTTTPDGFKVDSTGAKVVVENSPQTIKNGWVSENGSWYYYESGTLAKNKWLNLEGKWYFVLSDGSMVYNTWKEIDGKSYYFGSDGAMYVNATTPDGSKVDGNGAKVKTTNAVSLNNYIGVYDLWNADGPGYQMIITSISDNQICGAYAQIFDNKDTKGRYSEFTTALSNNQFIITGTEVKMQMGEAYEITGWSGVTGNFSSKYTLTYIDGVPAIIDKEYDTYSTYLRRMDSLSSSSTDSFWGFYSKVNGEYWKNLSAADYSAYVGLYIPERDYKEFLASKEKSIENYMSENIMPHIEISNIGNGIIEGRYYDGSSGASTETSGDIHSAITEDGSFSYLFEGKDYEFETSIILNLKLKLEKKAEKNVITVKEDFKNGDWKHITTDTYYKVK